MSRSTQEPIATSRRTVLTGLSVATPLRAVLQEAVDAWPGIDEPSASAFRDSDGVDFQVSGADFIEWFTLWRRKAKAAIGNGAAKQPAGPTELASMLPAGAAALGGPLPQTAGQSGDAELRRLWELYLANVAAHILAGEKMETPRAAYDAELPECPKDVLPGHHYRAYEWLWQKHGLDQLCDDCNAAYNAVTETVATIQRTQAEGIIGIGIKLAALPPVVRDDVDYYDAIVAALEDIDRLSGSSLAETLEGEFPAADEANEDEDEDGRVQS